MVMSWVLKVNGIQTGSEIAVNLRIACIKYEDQRNNEEEGKDTVQSQ